MKFIFNLKEIPNQARVCLWGAGGFGLHFKKILSQTRPDLHLICFIDSVKTGDIEGIPVFNLTDLIRSRIAYDLILITTSYFPEVALTLKQYGIRNYYFIPPLFKYLYTIEEDLYAKYKEPFEQVRDILHVDDRAFYTQLMGALRFSVDITHTYQILLAFYARMGLQYLDYINPAFVCNIIEGGVDDGLNTLTFLRMLPSDGILYGFEPFYEKYLHGLYAHYLAQWSNVVILPLGLGLRNATQSVKTGSDKTTVMEHFGQETEKVPVVSLDEFVKEKSLNRVDYIKMDIEGMEKEALNGSRDTLLRFRPQLAICIYHSITDYFEIPLLLHNLLDHYIYRLGYYNPLGLSEIVLYAVPEEKYR